MYISSFILILRIIEVIHSSSVYQFEMSGLLALGAGDELVLLAAGEIHEVQFQPQPRTCRFAVLAGGFAVLCARLFAFLSGRMVQAALRSASCRLPRPAQKGRADCVKCKIVGKNAKPIIAPLRLYIRTMKGWSDFI